MNAVERDDVYNPIHTLEIRNLFNVEAYGKESEFRAFC